MVLLQLLSIHDRAVGVTNLGVVLLWIGHVGEIMFVFWSVFQKYHES